MSKYRSYICTKCKTIISLNESGCSKKKRCPECKTATYLMTYSAYQKLKNHG